MLAKYTKSSNSVPRFNPFDYFFILRPLILIPAWNFLLIGSFLASRKGSFTVDVILGLVIYTFVLGGVYILNQIMDIETDRLNKKLFLLSAGYVPIRAAYTEMVALWILAIVFSVKFGTAFVILILLSILLGILYSVPPIKLKGKPFLDTLANGIGYGMINFAVGWLLIRDFQWSIFLRFLPYFLSICAVFVNTTVVDIEGDRRTQEITTGVFLGAKGALFISMAIMAAAIVSAFAQRDYICLIPAAASFPLFVYTAVHSLKNDRVHRKATIASFRLPGLLFTLITAVLYPVYLLILVVVLVAMRIYYRQRFGMTYPTLAQG
jgi:4-hydroxybenzoate polyprenyltransferase